MKEAGHDRRRFGESTRTLVSAVLTLIDRDFRDDLSLQTIARTLAMNPSHLTDTIRRSTGRPVYAWITYRRLSEARALLSTCDESIDAIARACGYHTTEAFVRAFRRRFACSLQAWRRTRRTPDARETPESMCAVFNVAQRFVATARESDSFERLNRDVLHSLRSIAGGASAVIHDYDPATRSWSRFDGRSEPTARAFSDADANVALLHLGRALHQSDLSTSDFPWYRRLAATRGLMAFDKHPIVIDDRCVAALAIGRIAPGDLSESTTAALTTITTAYTQTRTALTHKARSEPKETAHIPRTPT